MLLIVRVLRGLRHTKQLLRGVLHFLLNLVGQRYSTLDLIAEVELDLASGKLKHCHLSNPPS